MLLRYAMAKETLGGYDTICDHDGKICGAVNYQDEQFQIIQPEECKKHKGTQ